MKGQASAVSLPSHLEQIARAIHKRIDGKPTEGFGTPNLIVRRTITRLATLAGTRRLISHSATFRRAMIELQGKELPRASQRKEVKDRVAVIARYLDLADILPEPTPAPERKAPKRIKGINRVRVNGNWLEEHGVERNDRVLVAMTGDVRPGELGYFELHKQYADGREVYKQRALLFLTKRDAACNDWSPKEGICLRTWIGKCNGYHVGEEGQAVRHNPGEQYEYTRGAVFYGRVVGVERNGRTVETELPIRPFDERLEEQAIKRDWNPPPQPAPAMPAAPKPKERTTHIAEKDHSREHLGLLPGDELKVIECDDFNPGELVVLWDTDEKEWENIGTFDSYQDGEEWGPRCPRIVTKGGRHIYNPAGYEFYRIAEITRHIKVERLTGRGQGEDALTRRKIQQLRDRLSDIDPDDITNCSARLALETQIYNLEHPPRLDDWSEWEAEPPIAIEAAAKGVTP